MMLPKTARAMSLVELLVGLVVLCVLAITIAPALGTIRNEAENELSKANLMAMGQARDQYALDHKDQIFSYSWRAGETYVMPDGRVRNPSTDQDAAAFQNGEILMRRTGRISGATKFNNFTSRLPHRRFSHLVLLDYLSGDDDAQFNSNTVAIDPADHNQLNWHERPLEYGPSSGIPYSDGSVLNGYDNSISWQDVAVKQRWAFASSYQVVPFAWQGDGPWDVYVPTSSTPHLYMVRGNPVLGRRVMSDVAFPAQKVHMHEEFDFEQKRYPWFAYNLAKPEKLMFDGSINSERSGLANSGVSSDSPDEPWAQAYVPIDAFPLPLGGLGDNSELNMRYRWTEGGLQGVDYD